jgi:hypothetical protein
MPHIDAKDHALLLHSGCPEVLRNCVRHNLVPGANEKCTLEVGLDVIHPVEAHVR